MMRRIAVALAGLLAVAACTSPAGAPPGPSGPSQPGSSQDSSSQHSSSQHSSGQHGPSQPASTTATARASTSPAPQPRPVPHVIVTRTRMPDGSAVTLAVFSGPVTYVLHDGSEDPGLGAGWVRAGSAVRGTERGRLLAAFNGGFKLSAGAGGYEQEGHVAAALRPGETSLVIDRSGRA